MTGHTQGQGIGAVIMAVIALVAGLVTGDWKVVAVGVGILLVVALVFTVARRTGD